MANVGGVSRLTGDMAVAERLAMALDVPGTAEVEAAAREHVHGFHSYPARMHPQTARRLVEAFSSPRATVLDPFCGSGTVLVEARLAGRSAVGVDLNPLAVRLARLKVCGTTGRARSTLLKAAGEVAARADARRNARSGASRRYSPEDLALFDPHVLLELDGLRLALDTLSGAHADALRADLELVVSAILTKVSRRTSDSSGRELPRRIAPRYPTSLFLRKTEELVERLAVIAPVLAAAPAARVHEGDARRLEGVSSASIDLAVTSPPYPGVYDYLDHHAARLRWLGLPRASFERGEIGARRHLDPLGPEDGLRRWREELAAFLGALSRVLLPGARAAILIADSVVSGVRIDALDLLRALAPEAGLNVRAAASQSRPHFHGPTQRAFARHPRHEHAILLDNAGA